MKLKEAYTCPPISLQKSLEICIEGANAQVESLPLLELFIAHLQHPSVGLNHVLLPVTGEQVDLTHHRSYSLPTDSHNSEKRKNNLTHQCVLPSKRKHCGTEIKTMFDSHFSDHN